METGNKATEMKELVLVGGPNGAGKTTFINSFLLAENFTYLGADLIAYEMCPENVESVSFSAAREFLNRLQACRKSGKNVIVESTLAGKSLAKYIRKYKDAGYSIKLIFLTLPNQAASARRVKIRVAKGGHNVPEKDIERRFLRTHRNFWNLYRPLADRWYLFANQCEKHELVAAGEDDRYVSSDAAEMRYILWKLEN